MNRPQKNISRKEALSRAMRYCAYQERSSGDVVRKLYDWGLKAETDQAWVVEELQKEQFLDDKRFAKVFAKGKLNQNRWGRVKIRFALKEKGVVDSFIEEALAGLPQESYLNILKQTAIEKAAKTGLETAEQQGRVKRFLLQRGFQFDEINTVMKEIKQKI